MGQVSPVQAIDLTPIGPSHLERKFVTLVDGSNLYRGERLWGMQV
jgi:hypothetical protein